LWLLCLLWLKKHHQPPLPSVVKKSISTCVRKKLNREPRQRTQKEEDFLTTMGAQRTWTNWLFLILRQISRMGTDKTDPMKPKPKSPSYPCWSWNPWSKFFKNLL
jgi:hypothetical protein